MIRAPGSYDTAAPDQVLARAYEEWERNCTGRPQPDSAPDTGRQVEEDESESGGGGGTDFEGG